ncbi:MAG: toxin secretion ATP-binding protein [Alphaproteobacteria bacterium CG1_02_46_17]|nr:MAG: toxin secretion ATP-binding protein [Alphaproteobacteria bacterium CG1_02_46_17]
MTDQTPLSQDPKKTPSSSTQSEKDSQPHDSWPIEADRIALHFPLIECLRLLAGHYGRRTSENALTAGLPIPSTGITPALFERAALRADMNSKLAERSLESLAIAPNLPCILVLEHKQACILWEVRFHKNHPPKKVVGQNAEIHPETQFVLQFPESPDERKVVKFSELSKIFTNYCFFVRPVARVDDRAGPAEIDTASDWFWGSLKENWIIYREVILGTVMINCFALASTLYIMNVYDRVIPNGAYETLWVLSLGALIVYVFDFIMKNMRSYFLDVAGRKADVKISAKLFEQLLGMTLTSRPASAGVLASNMREFETIRDFFTSATMAALIDLPFSLFFIIIIAVIAGPLAIIPLVAIPIVILCGWVLQKPMQRIIRQSMHENALKNALLFEAITGLETIKTQAAEGHVQRRWEELTEKGSRTSVKSKRVAALALNFSLFVQQFTVVCMVIAGVYMISEAMLTQGALVGAVLLVGRALGPLAQVAGLMTRFNQSFEALRQLEDLMRRPVERPVGKHFISMPRIEGKIEFRDVEFKYPGQSYPAVQKLSLTINQGEHIGIIGAVGSGKTTLARLLVNLYQPSNGAILLDGTDVRQIDPGDLRRSIGAVQQSPNLFYGSVRENITMGHETAPDRAVVRSAELAGVLEFLQDTEKGLDTQVGERGEALSGGQRQAVAIARSLLYDPPILLLDEPTASMDPTSELKLRERLRTISRGKTTILITHKGAMLDLVDKLILLDRGNLVAFGPRDEIIRRLQAREFSGRTDVQAGA